MNDYLDKYYIVYKDLTRYGYNLEKEIIVSLIINQLGTHF